MKQCVGNTAASSNLHILTNYAIKEPVKSAGTYSTYIFSIFGLITKEKRISPWDLELRNKTDFEETERCTHT